MSTPGVARGAVHDDAAGHGERVVAVAVWKSESTTSYSWSRTGLTVRIAGLADDVDHVDVVHGAGKSQASGMRLRRRQRRCCHDRQNGSAAKLQRPGLADHVPLTNRVG